MRLGLGGARGAPAEEECREERAKWISDAGVASGGTPRPRLRLTSPRGSKVHTRRGEAVRFFPPPGKIPRSSVNTEIKAPRRLLACAPRRGPLPGDPCRGPFPGRLWRPSFQLHGASMGARLANTSRAPTTAAVPDVVGNRGEAGGRSSTWCFRWRSTSFGHTSPRPVPVQPGHKPRQRRVCRTRFGETWADAAAPRETRARKEGMEKCAAGALGRRRGDAITRRQTRSRASS